TLKKLGLCRISNTPCLYISNRLIVFFYVNNIIVLIHPNYLNAYREFKRKLI
ncbi:hypothetical protein K458DRAFT_314584, partial [Lentithecium fluviatile CBS 122367]